MKAKELKVGMRFYDPFDNIIRILMSKVRSHRPYICDPEDEIVCTFKRSDTINKYVYTIKNVLLFINNKAWILDEEEKYIGMTKDPYKCTGRILIEKGLDKDIDFPKGNVKNEMEGSLNYKKWLSDEMNRVLMAAHKRLQRTLREFPICPKHGVKGVLLDNEWNLYWVCKEDEKE